MMSFFFSNNTMTMLGPSHVVCSKILLVEQHQTHIADKETLQDNFIGSVDIFDRVTLMHLCKLKPKQK